MASSLLCCRFATCSATCRSKRSRSSSLATYACVGHWKLSEWHCVLKTPKTLYWKTSETAADTPRGDEGEGQGARGGPGKRGTEDGGKRRRDKEGEPTSCKLQCSRCVQRRLTHCQRLPPQTALASLWQHPVLCSPPFHFASLPLPPGPPLRARGAGVTAGNANYTEGPRCLGKVRR